MLHMPIPAGSAGRARQDEERLSSLSASADIVGYQKRVLSERGQHQAPSVPDLLIAATAELADLTVLHLDKDFELIAAITGLRVQRLDMS
jgi:predicted nucleic acid-binding protein